MSGDENNDVIAIPDAEEESLLPSEGASAPAEENIVGVPIPDGEAAGGDIGAADLSLPIGEEALLDDPGMLPDPSENPDPQIAVNDMLSEAALLPDPVESIPHTSLEGMPTFQVKLTPANEEQREALKKIVLALKLGDEEACKAMQPIFTHLNEYQAIQLMQELRAVGISAQADVKWPQAVPTEEEAALGSLANVPDPMISIIEGAPSVILPTSSNDVLLLTTETIPGYQVQQVMGLVSAHKSIARRFFKEQELQKQVEEEIQKYPGKKPQMPKNQLERLFRELFQNLQKNALGMGANAVVGVKMEAFPESSHLDSALEQMRLVALGTAAVVEKSSI